MPGAIRSILRDLHALQGPLTLFEMTDALDCPMAQFEVWMHEAIHREVPEPHAMTLSTVDTTGKPDSRVLLLKDLDEDGWHFAANAASPKGRQMALHADVALAFYWPMLGRQVRIRGAVADLGRARSAEDFLARSPSSRASALVGRQSEPMREPHELDDEFEAQLRLVKADSTLISRTWTAYVVRAEDVEFWQGATNRRHQRLRYSRCASGWRKEFLSP